MLMKLIGILALAFLIYLTPSCNEQKKEVPQVGTTKVFAVYCDSGRVIPDIIIRQITRVIKVDSISGKESIVTDTLYGVEKKVTVRDSSGKPVQRFIPFLIPKDSVNTFVQNIPIENLLDRKKWKKP